MNANQNSQTHSEKWRATLQSWLVYLRKTSLYTLGIAALIGISFMFTGGFSAKAYSDRLFIAGICITMVGVFVFITMAGTRKNMGLPTIAKTEVDARTLIDRTQELIDKAEKRYDAGAQVWAVGIACMVLSLFSYFLLSILKF